MKQRLLNGTHTNLDEIEKISHILNVQERALAESHLDRLEKKNEELHKLEAEIFEATQRFQKVFRDSGIGIAVIDLTGRWKEVNSKLCEVFGYARSEMISGMTFQDVTVEEDLKEDLNLLRQLMMGEIKSYQMAKSYIKKDGSRFKAILNVSLIKDEAGAPLYFVSQIIPVEDIKKVLSKLEHE